MPETAVCSKHIDDSLVRTKARRAGEGAEDFDGDLDFKDCAGNDCLACIECGAGA